MADIRTKDGIYVRGIPEGQERSDAIKSYVANIRATQGAGEYNFSQTPQNAPSAQQQGTPQSVATPTDSFPGQQPQVQGQSVLQRAGSDFKGGLDATIRGAVPLLTAEAVSTPIVDTINKMLGTNFERPADGMRAILERAGVEAPQNKAEEIVQTMSETILETMATMGAGTAMQAGKGLAQTVGKGIGKTLASQPVQQISGAAGGGAAAKIAEQQGAGVGGQILAGLAGGGLSSGLSNIKGTQLPKAPLKEATAAGVDLLTSDVRPPKTFISKWAQSIGEKIPVVGTGKIRETQQVQRIDAVKNLLQKHGIDDLANMSDEAAKVTDDLIGRQKRLIGAYSNAKNEVIDRLSDSDIVPMNKSISTIDEQIARLKGLKNSQLDPLISQLEETKKSVGDQTLRNVEENRKLLGDFFDTMKDDKAISRNKKKVLDEVYGSVNEDMGDYIKLKGEPKDFTKWKSTNVAINKNLNNVKTDILKRTMNKGEATPEMIERVLFSKKKSEVTDLFNNLSPRGKASARTAILLKASEQAGDNVSPEKFANAVSKLGTQTGVFFTKQDSDQVKGLMRVLDATRRASQAAVAPPTGQALIPFATASAGAALGEALGVGAIPGSIATALTAGTLARVYESKAVRNILMKLPTVAQGSAQEAALFKRLAETARAVQGAEEKEK
jgi:hypothetical protein